MRIIQAKPPAAASRLMPAHGNLDGFDVGRNKQAVSEAERQGVSGGISTARGGIAGLRPIESPSGDGLGWRLQAITGFPLSLQPSLRAIAYMPLLPSKCQFGSILLAHYLR